MELQKLRLKKGDTVVVLSGRDKGRKGKIMEVQTSSGKVIVEGLNTVKKHTKPTKANPQGGVLDKALGIPASRVMLVCASCNQPTRIHRKRVADGKLVRACKHCGAEME